MAGDWTPVEHATPNKPEVLRMAVLLDMEPDHVVGKCVRFWIWCDQNVIAGNAPGVTAELLDRLLNCPGFGAAISAVDWASFQNDGMHLPNWQRLLGKGAKTRLLTNRRVAEMRDRKKRDSNDTVTPTPLQERIPEKRREEGTPVGRSPAPPRARTRAREGTTTTTRSASAEEEQTIAIIVRAWNEICKPTGLPAALYRTDGRDEKILTFWRWINGNAEALAALFHRVAQSPLLHGQKDRNRGKPGYRATFEKVIEPELAARILEGEFDPVN